MPNFEEDDCCTADPGLLGERSCHLYPGCGCGQQEDYDCGYDGPDYIPSVDEFDKRFQTEINLAEFIDECMEEGSTTFIIIGKA